MKNSSWVDDLNKNFDSIAPILFLYDRNTKESKEISKAIRAFYLNNEEISIKTEKALGQVRCYICLYNHYEILFNEHLINIYLNGNMYKT